MNSISYYIIIYFGSVFLFFFGLLGLLFHSFFPVNLVSAKYQGQGIEIQTTSLATMLLFGSIAVFFWAIKEHKKCEEKEKETEKWKSMFEQLKQISNSSTTVSSTKEEK